MVLRVALFLDGDASGAKVALDQTAAGLEKVTKVAQTSKANIGNIAAQLQDIGVGIAGGQGPLQIALQQGTQLSQIIGQSGAAGAFSSLASAAMSIVNPVSLVTIGTIALGSAALQAFMGMGRESEKTVHSLEEHDKWLKEILKGYESAAKAAGQAAAEAAKLPAGAVQSNLEADRKKQAEEYRQKLDEVRAVQTATIIDYVNTYESVADRDPIVRQVEELRKLQAQLGEANPRLADVVTRLTEIANSDGAYFTVKTTAEKMLELAISAQNASAALAGTEAALRGVGVNLAAISQFNRNLDATSAAIEKMKSLAPDLRNAYQQNEDALKNALKSAPSDILRYAAQKQFEDTKKALDAQKAQQAALKIDKAAAKVDPFERAMGQTDKRAADLALEIGLVGKSTLEIEKARKARELENAAKDAGIPLTAKVLADIDASANAYARNTVALTAAQEAFKTIQQVGVSAWDSIVDGALSGGKNMSEVIKNIAAEYAKMALQMAVFNPMKNALLGTNAATFQDGIGGFLAGLFGRREMGGPVVAGRPYIVGEKRPEVFVPTSSGTIIPSISAMGAAGGGGMRFSQTIINQSDAKVSSRQRQRSDGSVVQELVISTTQRAMDRGQFKQFGIGPPAISR